MGGGEYRQMKKVTEYPYESWVSPKIEMRSSPIHGRGTFTTSPIETAETVVIWGARTSEWTRPSVPERTASL